MASIQIPNLPAVVGLSGTELFEAVQAGTSVKISLNQIIAAVIGQDPLEFPIPVSLGGTGIATYAIGDILFASATQTFSKLADVATGNALISGGVGAAPSYGKIGLTTHVSGTLPVANGGTGVTTSTGTGSVVLSASPALTGNVTVTTNSASAAVTINQTGAGNAFVVEDSASPDASPFVIDASGNVGIGTTSPLAKVHSQVNTFTTADMVAYKAYNNQAVGVYANFQNSATGTAITDGFLIGIGDAEDAVLQNQEATNMIFSTNATERMRIDASGNVAIGANTPRDRLSIFSANGTAPSNTSLSNALRITSTATAGVGVGPSMLFEGQTGNATAQYGFAAIQGFKGSATAADYSGTLAFFVQPSGGASLLTERLRIEGAGQIGIGGANYGTSGQTIISAGSGAAAAWGAVGAAGGGTGITSYTIGDIVYASGTTTLSKLADVATGNALISGGVGAAPSYGKIGLTTHVSGTLPLANGGTGATSAPAAAAALLGYTATATAGATTTLTNASTQYQLFTGATTQTITLPVTSTLGTGWSFHIVNNSTGSLTVNSSGGNLVVTVIAGLSAMVTCIGTTLTTAADWEAGFTDFQAATGTGSVVLSASPTLTGTTAVAALTATGAISDAIGNVRDLVNSDKTAAYVPAATDNGKLINITTGGITINASVFTAGQNVTIYNNSGSSQTITQGTSVTLRLAGSATTGNRTLALRGIATVVCVASNEFVVSGAGLT
jgi:hypothetical protein